MGPRTMLGLPRTWAVSYTQSRCITWAARAPEMRDTQLFSIIKDTRTPTFVRHETRRARAEARPTGTHRDDRRPGTLAALGYETPRA